MDHHDRFLKAGSALLGVWGSFFLLRLGLVLGALFLRWGGVAGWWVCCVRTVEWTRALFPPRVWWGGVFSFFDFFVEV